MVSWSIRRALFVIVSALVLVTGAAWVGVTDEMVDDGSTVSEAPTTSDRRLQASGSTTTSPRGWEGDVGLFRVDPATLAPVPGSRPITSGDWISGSMSENGEWLGQSSTSG